MRFLVMCIMAVSMLFGAVDINTADKKELMSLNGIGAKKAALIIEYREHNCFRSVDQLVNVKGIGRGLLMKNKDNLEASECKSK